MNITLQSYSATISGNDTVVTFTWSDGSTETLTIAFPQFASKADMDTAIYNYALAYQAGKAIEAAQTVTLPSDVTSGAIQAVADSTAIQAILTAQGAQPEVGAQTLNTAEPAIGTPLKPQV